MIVAGNNKEIGRRLSLIREKSHITQAKMGEFLSVDQGHISKLESGKRNFNSMMLESLGALFGCGIEYFLSDEFVEQEPIKVALRADEVSGEDLKVIADIGRMTLNLRFVEGVMNDHE
jgi:transcriptional regulator with XRE-family HTH domain